MRYLKGIRWFLVTIAMTGSVVADVIIDNQSIPGTDIQSIIVGPTSGDIFITTNTGYTVTPDGTVPVDVAAITTFSASPTTIEKGKATTIVWASQNTNTCEAIGGTGGWAAASVPLSGNTNIVIDVVGTYAFTLKCVGDAGTVQDQLSVKVIEPTTVPTNCDAPTLGGLTVAWQDFWNGTAFPDPTYANEFTEIPRNGFLAIEFNTADILDTGLLTTIETTATRGRRLGSVSQCPGDFDVTDLCRHIWGTGGEIFWSTEGYSKACQLEPNTTYYFNVTFTDGVDPSSSECVSTSCITKLRTYNPEG